MKKWIVMYIVLAVGLLAGCGKTEPIENTNTMIDEPVTQEPGQLKEYRFRSAEEVEQMSDEDLIYINQNPYETADFYDEGEFTQIDFFGVDLDQENGEEACIDFFWFEDLEIELDVSKPIPEDEFERLVEENIQEIFFYADTKEPDEETGDVVISKETIFCGENDIYAEYCVRYTQRRTMRENNVLTSSDIPRAYRQIYLKNYLVETNIEEWKAYLLGDLSVDYVKEQLDVLYSMGMPIIYREVKEEETCYTYVLYGTKFEYSEAGINNSVILWKDTKIVDKDTHLIKNNGSVEIRRVEIEGTEYDVMPVY